jgi:hypothetical protein
VSNPIWDAYILVYIYRPSKFYFLISIAYDASWLSCKWVLLLIYMRISVGRWHVNAVVYSCFTKCSCGGLVIGPKELHEERKTHNHHLHAYRNELHPRASLLCIKRVKSVAHASFMMWVKARKTTRTWTRVYFMRHDSRVSQRSIMKIYKVIGTCTFSDEFRSEILHAMQCCKH